ncbi:MAG: ribosome assembly cofactor RimP [Flavobacteriales bacterium]|nr:ribosome assembly cofactor RimP [Flavobacteriales bacterium]
MISKGHIEELVKEKIADTEYFIVDIIISSSNQIRVEIDGNEGVNINDCVQISRHIEASFDREEVDFELTVSSAGMDQPFKILRQYQRYLGREVEIKTTKGEKLKGKLISANEERVEIETSRKERIEKKKKKQLIIENQLIPMEQVKETKVVISFK